MDLLEQGHQPETVLGMLLKDDPPRDKRQLAIITLAGRAAIIWLVVIPLEGSVSLKTLPTHAYT